MWLFFGLPVWWLFGLPLGGALVFFLTAPSLQLVVAMLVVFVGLGWLARRALNY